MRPTTHYSSKSAVRLKHHCAELAAWVKGGGKMKVESRAPGVRLVAMEAVGEIGRAHV